MLIQETDVQLPNYLYVDDGGAGVCLSWIARNVSA